jgi:fructose/tagatose bisphosphate aldolase
VDLRSPADLKQLAAVFAAADHARLPIIIHLESRAKDYGAQDAAAFLAQVLPSAPHVTVQIAHAAGGGGITPGTLSALRTFADAIKADPKGTRNVIFDLAMVPDEMSNTEKLSAAPQDVATLKALMHEIGMNRFLMASDWTQGLDLSHYYDGEHAALALEPAEWKVLAANVAPYIRAAAPPGDCPAKS